MASPAVTLEDKIVLAAEESERVIAIFAPKVADLVAQGVTVEPILSGLAKLVIGVFRHHTATPAVTK